MTGTGQLTHFISTAACSAARVRGWGARRRMLRQLDNHPAAAASLSASAGAGATDQDPRGPHQAYGGGMPTAQELEAAGVPLTASGGSVINLGGYSIKGGVAPLPDRSRSVLGARRHWHAAAAVSKVTLSRPEAYHQRHDGSSSGSGMDGSAGDGSSAARPSSALQGLAATRRGPLAKPGVVRLTITKDGYAFVADPPAGLSGPAGPDAGLRTHSTAAGSRLPVSKAPRGPVSIRSPAGLGAAAGRDGTVPAGAVASTAPPADDPQAKPCSS